MAALVVYTLFAVLGTIVSAYKLDQRGYKTHTDYDDNPLLVAVLTTLLTVGLWGWLVASIGLILPVVIGLSFAAFNLVTLYYEELVYGGTRHSLVGFIVGGTIGWSILISMWVMVL